jgi:hypothetical protein
MEASHVLTATHGVARIYLMRTREMWPPTIATQTIFTLQVLTGCTQVVMTFQYLYKMHSHSRPVVSEL